MDTSETNAGSQKRRYTDRDIERDRKAQAEVDENVAAEAAAVARKRKDGKVETFRLEPPSGILETEDKRTATPAKYVYPSKSPIKPPKRRPKE